MLKHIIFLIVFIFAFISDAFAINKNKLSEIIRQENNNKLTINDLGYDSKGSIYVLSSTDRNKVKLGEGPFAYYLSKYDSSGNRIFQKAFGAAPYAVSKLGITSNDLPFVFYTFAYYHYFYLFSQKGDSLLWINGGEGDFIYSSDTIGNIYLYRDGLVEEFSIISNEGKIVKRVEAKQSGSVGFTNANIQPISNDRILLVGVDYENKTRYYTFDYSTGNKSEYKEIDPTEYAEVQISDFRIPATTGVQRDDGIIFYVPDLKQTSKQITYRIKFNLKGEPIKRKSKSTNIQNATSIQKLDDFKKAKLGATTFISGFPANGMYLYSIDDDGNLFYEKVESEQIIDSPKIR